MGFAGRDGWCAWSTNSGDEKEGMCAGGDVQRLGYKKYNLDLFAMQRVLLAAA